jgi:hypothetical protein
MLTRGCGLLLLLAVAASASGCCCVKNWMHGLHAKKHCRWGCGEHYWNEWHNDPPDTCDPCDDWGNFTGRRWVEPCADCTPRGHHHGAGHRCTSCADRGDAFDSPEHIHPEVPLARRPARPAR